MLLIDSIKTIKGISAFGVLWGTRWANIWLVKLIHPYNINLSQNGRANVNVIVIWLEDVKIYGNNPIKLFIKIKINSVIKIIVDPWFEVGPKSILNSMWSFRKILLIIEVCLFLITQKLGTIIIINKRDLNQFNEILKFADGSNTENRLVIIFKRIYYKAVEKNFLLKKFFRKNYKMKFL